MDRDNLRDAAFRIVLDELRAERDGIDQLIKTLELVETSDDRIRAQEIMAALRRPREAGSGAPATHPSGESEPVVTQASTDPAP